MKDILSTKRTVEKGKTPKEGYEKGKEKNQEMCFLIFFFISFLYDLAILRQLLEFYYHVFHRKDFLGVEEENKCEREDEKQNE